MQDRGNLPQNFVTQEVSELVIEPLELIDIDHDDGHTSAKTAGALEFLGEAQLEEAAIEDASEPVDICQLLDPVDVMSILDGSGTDIGNGLERLGLAFLEHAGPRTVQHQHAQCLSEGNERNAHAGTGLG